MVIFKRGIRYIRRVKPAKLKQDAFSQMKHLYDIEHDRSRSFVDKSADAIKVYMSLLDGANGDPQFWRSVKLFESASPSAPQVAPLLSRLWVLAANSDKSSLQENLRTVGDLAYSVGLIEDEWLEKYMNALSYKNPYRAIELWTKNRAKFSNDLGAKYYCRAGLPKKAESLIGSELSSSVWREFILAYCKQNNATKVDEWVRKKSDPSEKDLKWIWHVLILYNMHNAASKSLPKPTWQVPAPTKRKLGQREYNLIQEVSKLVCMHPQILEDDLLYKSWAEFVIEPDIHQRLLPVLDAIVHEDSLVAIGPVLKNLHKRDITKMVLKMDADESYPSPGLWEWAQAAQHAKNAEEAAFVCEKMRLHGYLFTYQGFNAVCNSKVPNLVRLAEEARDRIELSEHMQICVWRKLEQPAPDWLWELNKEQQPSFKLLKNILIHCFDNNNIVGVAKALHSFMVVNNTELDETFVEWMFKYVEGNAKEIKFSSPRDDSGGVEKWLDVCKELCNKTHTDVKWVLKHSHF